MAAFGPWGAEPDERHVAVAVSGGADSLALAWLAGRWGRVTALTVDHGLRGESASEARSVAGLVRSWGGRAVILTLSGLERGPGLAARARSARHRALQECCRDTGLPDLLLGHHAGDQAETIAMRRERGSGEAGLAGMAAIAERTHARLLRPFLAVPPGRLRATLREADVAWADDPGNADIRTGRGRVRAMQADPEGDGVEVRDAVAASVTAGRRRATQDQAVAAALARCSIFPAGYAIIPDAPIMPEALAGLLRGVAGSDYAPSLRQVARLAHAPGPATLAGCRLSRAGRAGWLVTREVAAMAPAAAGEWDGRYRMRPTAGASLGALGPDASRFRKRTRLPAVVLQALPAGRAADMLFCVPHVAFPAAAMHDRSLMIEPNCCPPAGAPFAVPA